jgi:uncharacterized protein (TIGR00299 family) protein
MSSPEGNAIDSRGGPLKPGGLHTAENRLHGATLYIDCYAGVAGDMVVGALVDLGVPEAVVRGAVAGLGISGVALALKRVRRGALFGTKLTVEVGEQQEEHDHGHGEGEPHEHEHVHGSHRHWKEIRALIERATIDPGIKRRAIAMFERIAHVEAHLHGVSVDEVAFHEVGAVDSIVDLVATAAALDWLKPARVVSRRVPLGHGTVETAHGRLPVPAPATLELLAGAEVEEGGCPAACELTTPTGAAIVAANAAAYGALPPLEVLAVGWGAGERELPDRPNLLRVVAGRARVETAREQAVVIEANVDDLTPELAAPLIEALLAAGARDAWLAPALMKKGRPALIVGAVCEPDRRSVLADLLFRESSTIGVRWHAVERAVLERRTVEVETRWGKVALKVSGPADAPLNASPEYEACRTLARAHGIATKQVYAEALAAYYKS